MKLNYTRRGFSVPCTDHDWRTGLIVVSPKKSELTREFSCNRCYGLVLIESLESESVYPSWPPRPPVSHDALLKAITEE